MQAGLDIVHLRKRYGGFTAVDGLGFQVEPGRFFSILGPSGCGKTTLLRMIAGFIEPDEGDIRIGGVSQLGIAPNRRKANLVFQHLALFPMMSVGENVAYGLRRRGVAQSSALAQARQMLVRVGLPGSEGKRVDQLSGGQRQRVALARCLVLEPSLLLLDEPLGALDLKLREQMKVELKQLQVEFGTTFVYITHDQSEALVLSDRVAVMNAGRFEQVGAPAELYHEPATAFVAGFVGDANRLAGSAIAAGSGTVRVRFEGGLELDVRCRDRLADGACQVYLRPESLKVAEAGRGARDGETHLEGVVEAALFDGARSTLLVQVRGLAQPVRAAWPQGTTASIGRGTAVRLVIEGAQGWGFAA